MKLTIVYRVVQHWRAPIFEKISAIRGVDLTVICGRDFDGTKIVSSSSTNKFSLRKLKSINIRIGTRNGIAYVPFIPGLLVELYKTHPDVIICEGASNIFSNATCFLYSKIAGVPLLQWGLGEIEGRRRSPHRRLVDIFFRFIERHSDGAIAYSSFGKAYYERIGIPANRAFRAVNVVDTERRTAEFLRYGQDRKLCIPSPLPSAFNVLFVGALSENKGIDKLIHAFSALQKEVPTESSRLTIVGDGPDRQMLEDLVHELELEHVVDMPGQVGEGISKYFYNASIFVLPGLGGLAVSDALVHGVPVVATIGDGCEKDLIEDGVNGYYVPGLTVESLTEILLELFHDRAKLADLRAGAQKFTDGPYNVNSYIDRIIEAARIVKDAKRN